jgi:midasin (ATPase involved in ribosome maturation)
MSGFAALKTFEESLDTATPVAENAAVEYLRKAVNAPSVPDVEKMIHEGIIRHNMLNKIELKIGEVTKTLDDEPRHFLFPEILTTVNANIPTALIGPAGSGKSTVVEQVAKALELKFYLQNSVSGAHELAGYLDAHGKYNTTTFRTVFENGGVFFIDEVDTSDAGALKWLNGALANGHAMFPDKPDPVNRHPKFRAIIAANTYGTGADRMYVGANQLDASTLDRFVFFDFGYDEKLETALSGNIDWAKRVQELRAAAFAEKARIVISPRASINGAKLLAAGWAQELVEERIIWKGLDLELKRRILDKAAGVLSQAELDKATKPTKKKGK